MFCDHLRGKFEVERLDKHKAIQLIGQHLFYLLLMVVLFSCDKKAGESEVELKEGESVFELKEVSTFDFPQSSTSFVRGQSSSCSEEPEGGVKGYPAFKSDRPLYGSFYFRGKPVRAKRMSMCSFAVDESRGTGEGYDRLYLDLDGDRDLRNDRPLSLLKRPPEGALLSWSIKEQVCFKYFNVAFDFGEGGKRSIEIMPRFITYEGGRNEMYFVATKVRKGRVEIGGEEYIALLGYSDSIGDGLDRPSTDFYLVREDKAEQRYSWLRSDNLNVTRSINGQYYRFGSTATGDKLIVRPYDGEVGMFEIGAGGRDIQEMSARGSLSSKETAVEVGEEVESGQLKETLSCSLPVGDYLPRHLTINYGRLRVFLSSNYYVDGGHRNYNEYPGIRSIKIRKDEAYILDFSNKPEIMFASPAKEGRVRLGEELKVEAVLIDSKLDIMIRNLYDTTRKVMKEYENPDGKKHSLERDLLLEPTVVIRRGNGEKVAEGVMPFG